MAVDRLVLGELRIEGVSRAGDETWFRVHPPGLAFDVGRGALKLAGSRDIFLSHGHLDHALGLPFVLSQRSLHDPEETRIFAPRSLIEDLQSLVRAAEVLAQETYRFRLVPLDPGETVEVGRDLEIEAFATRHVVPSLGYHLLRKRSRLRAEYRDRSADELASLRRAGVDLESVDPEIWLSYCGDTGPEVFDLEPRIFASPVLLLECTFFDEDARDRATRFGHMHLEDLVARAALFENQDLVLHHASRRHDCPSLVAAIDSRLQLEGTRVHLFGCQ